MKKLMGELKLYCVSALRMDVLLQLMLHLSNISEVQSLTLIAESCKKCHVSSDSLGCGGKVIIKYVHLVHMLTLEPASTAPAT